MVDTGRVLPERIVALDTARTCTCSAEAVVGVAVGDKEEEVDRGGGFVVGFVMVGGSFLFYAASRTVTDPCDGGRVVVCLVTMRAVAAANMIACALLTSWLVAAENKGQ